MAIKIKGNVVIANDERGSFNLVNAGAYTQEELDNLVVRGVSVGDATYNKDKEALNYWDGSRWVPVGSVYGEEEFLNPGTFTWVCPLNVDNVCVVCVGGGGSGGAILYETGGGGGGLGWRNNIPVTPGERYTVVVGSGGLYGLNEGNGGDSYFQNPEIVLGGGGLGGNYDFDNGGRFVGQGGGKGGGTAGANIVAHGGSGAGGYDGNGGDANNNSAGSPGNGGGGGAGQDAGVYYGMRGNGGGGVGIYGQGASGKGGGNIIWEPNNNQSDNQAGWLDYSGPGPGKGGSPNHGTGTDGTKGSVEREDPWEGGNGNGGFPGGGGGQQEGGNPYDYYAEGTPGRGGGGAVRILWGPGRRFPNTYVNKNELPE